MVDGEALETIHVDSGVLQETVLGPLMCLLYINDIAKNISSTIKLFADDCLLFREINTMKDTKVLQKDLKKLNNWTAGGWYMYLVRWSATPCESIANRSPSSTTTPWEMRHIPRSQASPKKLSWKFHIKAVAPKANKTLAFIDAITAYVLPPSRNSHAQYQACTTLVRSQLEYGATIWDPYRQNQIDNLEKVQRRGRATITITSSHDVQQSDSHSSPRLHQT